jgi:predicted TIM-barrel fold metal-dependent hydrolase
MTDRRTVLSAAAGVAAVAGLKPVLGAEKITDVIDAHSHIWTRDIEKFPLAKTAKVADLDPASFTTAELLALVRPLGVNRVVLIQHHLFYGYDNTYMIDAARRHPGVFRVVGMVDELKPNVAERMRTLAKQQVSGFRITSWIRKEKWLTGPGMKSMWECAAATGQAICCLMDPPFLESLDKMCKRRPDTRVVVDHFARIGVDGKIRKADVDQLCELAKHRNTHVKISAYYALGAKKPPYDDLVPMIRRLLDAYGAERLMWASDSPYQLQDGNTYKASLDLIRSRLDFLSQAERLALLKGTAERVYFGELRP